MLRFSFDATQMHFLYCSLYFKLSAATFAYIDFQISFNKSSARLFSLKFNLILTTEKTLINSNVFNKGIRRLEKS